MTDHATRMMDEFDRGAWRFLKALLAVLLLILYLLAIAWWLEPAPDMRPPRRDFTPAERKWIAERHRYHGITGSVMENGQHYFYRNGKRCKL